jgi:molybdate-binding protein
VAAALRIASAFGERVEAVFAAHQARPLVWAWEPGAADDGRVWRASVNGRTLLFPVEPTAGGVLPHDAWFDGGQLQPRTGVVAPDRTLVIAGCDPLVSLLARELARHDVRVLPLLRASTSALDLLRQGLVHAAGLHLTDATGTTTNDRTVRAAAGAGHRLIHQMRWDAGIAVAGQRRERTPTALLRANVRWVNREQGSAARQAFDMLLAARRRPEGYQHVVRDHRSVAATVSSGWAEAGVCVRPAAAEARLTFIPLQREAYELCVAESQIEDPRIAALIAALQSKGYRQLVADVPGCESAHTGDVRSVA